MNKKLKEKIIESLSAVFPVTIIVLFLCFTISPMPLAPLMLFIIGAVLLIVGMGFFTLGADMAMMPIGETVGKQLVKSKKMNRIIFICFLIGVLITLAEPDLKVLAGQMPTVPDNALIFSVAFGVGIFLAISFLKILLGWDLGRLLIIFYFAIFTLAIFVPKDFLAVAFDSGGVTTGPITVPFIMSLGIGLASLGKSKNAESDNFGLVSLCSIGPIIAVMILGLVYKADSSSYTSSIIPNVNDTRDLALLFVHNFPEYFLEVAKVLFPILFAFTVFQFIFIKLSKHRFIKIIIGMIYTLLGLVLFLTGVNVGFMPAGHYLGQQLAQLDFNWIMIPIGMIIGYFIVKAEPAVLVLNKQVEEITNGTISQKTMMNGLSIGMAISVGLSMLRVLTGISLLWFLIPGYILALSFSFIVPKIFTSIAFDSGGVASGPMTATFLMPFAMGACESLGANVLTDAFGIVAMVAMTPLVIIQLIGLLYKIKTKHSLENELVLSLEDAEIVEFCIEE